MSFHEADDDDCDDDVDDTNSDSNSVVGSCANNTATQIASDTVGGVVVLATEPKTAAVAPLLRPKVGCCEYMRSSRLAGDWVALELDVVKSLKSTPYTFFVSENAVLINCILYTYHLDWGKI